ncbi:MATE family efflux transporter [Pseudonocardia acaciae]|uniref:MATE family efflux transporter n=1 Tax=Pseudonocardia acaciae TaxID=551276 RepID=UPI00048D2EBE|nr:MATE family efflux transporter [Pseudonocardia acaciae]
MTTGLTRRALTEHRALAALATPLALTQLAQVALTTTDTVMLGRLGATALAGGGLAIVLFNQLRTMGVGLVTAVGNQVAAAVSRAETTGGVDGGSARDEVRDLVRAAVAVATVAGVLGGLVMVGFGQLLGWLGQDAEVAALTRTMLVTLAPGLLPCLWFQALRQYSVGMRRPRALLVITLVSIVINAGLNLLLGFGAGSWPGLGVAGIGTATSLVYLLTFGLLYRAVRRDPELAPALSLAGWRASAPTVRRLLRLGFPIAATYGSEAGFFSVVALVMGGFSAAALAAHTVVNQLVYIVFQASVGASHGASILVSREWAAGRRDTPARLARTALTQGALIVAAVAVVYLVAPGAMLGLFLDATDPADAAALVVAGQLLMVAAVLQFADSAQNIGVGLLRGLDDTTGGFRATLIGYWLVGLPVALVLGLPLGLGPVGVWLGLLTGLTATAALLLARYTRRLHRP